MMTTIQGARNAVDKTERDYTAAYRRYKAHMSDDTALILEDAERRLRKAEHDLAELLRAQPGTSERKV